jgi:hypothetical protein
MRRLKGGVVVRLAALVWMMLATALVGAAVMVVVAVPSLYDNGMKLIPWAAAAGAVIAIPLAIAIARKIQTSARSV